MKKIMFCDKYGLTKAVLEGRKTQTRRVITTNLYNSVDWKAFEEGNYDCMITDDAFTVTDIRDYAAYRIGEEVAIAQSYKDCGYTIESGCYDTMGGYVKYGDKNAGWNNKMFVRADLMPHRIRITNVRVERLQDISDEDCLKEGIGRRGDAPLEFFVYGEDDILFDTPQRVFASLIDKTCGKGTWDSNPWVFVYDFELIK